MSRKTMDAPYKDSFERNRYFTGKYMTARDFAADQAYFLSRRSIHNRLLHGWGIVCGLRVVPHPTPECRESWVVVKAGIAIDCTGREVFLPNDLAVQLPMDELPPWSDEEPGAPDVPEAEPAELDDDALMHGWAQPDAERDWDDDDNGDSDEADEGHAGRPRERAVTRPAVWPERPRRGLLVCLKYTEKLVEPVPAIYAEGECDPNHHEANRIREVGEVEIRKLEDMHADCWRLPGGGPVDVRDDCDEPLPGPAGVCLDADCPCHGCVPLALLLRRPRWKPGESPLLIDHRGRRRLPTPSHYLTHVAQINWPHGGTLSLAQLRQLLDGRLMVRFDRRIRPAVGMRSGINPCTFVVQYGGIQKSLEFLHAEEDPRLLPDERTAVYSIHRDYLSRRRDNIAGTLVYITLKCDFILDCHDMPVDGAHLGGRLPSGDGTPGGIFHSWFSVVHSHGRREND